MNEALHRSRAQSADRSTAPVWASFPVSFAFADVLLKPLESLMTPGPLLMTPLETSTAPVEWLTAPVVWLATPFETLTTPFETLAAPLEALTALSEPLTAPLETPVSVGVLVVGLGLLALGLLFGGWLSRRARVEPLGYWPVAWAVLVVLGVARVAGGPHSVEYGGTVIFCSLLLAGAYRYADRPVPKHILGFSFVASGALLVLGQPSVAQPFASVATLALALSMTLAAAALTHRAAKRRGASLLHRILPVGLVGIAVVGALDHLVLNRSLDTIAVWLIAGVPIATNQAVAVFDRVRNRADLIAEELEMSISLLQATLESTADGILVVDTNGRYTSHNQLFQTMWGIPDEIMEDGRSETVLQYAKTQLKDPEGFYANVKALYANPELESFDTLEFADDRRIERYSRPQKVGDQIYGRVWSFRDVTARKRAEEVVLRDKEQLEEVVSLRTRELVESRDRLRHADRLVAIGTLAAGVAHQINNPIGAILNSAEYALLCAEDGDAEEILRDALLVNASEARRCGAIVRGILQFSRQEPIERLPEDLNQVVRLSLKAVESYARDRGAEVRVEFAEQRIQVLVSPLEMEQVIVNLLRNAIESRPTRAEVRLRTFVDQGFAHLEVTDNGTGIKSQDRARVFDPFFSTRIMEGGTGLGLSVAHGIVTDHGGKIGIDSTPSEGTTITVDLPLDVE